MKVGLRLGVRGSESGRRRANSGREDPLALLSVHCSGGHVVRDLDVGGIGDNGGDRRGVCGWERVWGVADTAGSVQGRSESPALGLVTRATCYSR